MLEQKVKEAIVDELKRQAQLRPNDLKVAQDGHKIHVNGDIDLDDLTMVVIGSIAGGP
ncbi:hypothetical protein [Chelativorans salis]|uniref:Uncharacterized protein n=1 Tax=Chelativorans salis TaxID=2978478 RepID=A0ABT2LUI0_9HYPH|nr:hypothetical protein [Chelativorans sp. EGI FJ00035]MCT7378185.1 hypothetical protein [Chelativorans sp. EGI FJ00035]